MKLNALCRTTVFATDGDNANIYVHFNIHDWLRATPFGEPEHTGSNDRHPTITI